MVEAPGIECKGSTSPDVVLSIENVGDSTSPPSPPDDDARRDDPERLRLEARLAIEAGEYERARAILERLERRDVKPANIVVLDTRRRGAR